MLPFIPTRRVGIGKILVCTSTSDEVAVGWAVVDGVVAVDVK